MVTSTLAAWKRLKMRWRPQECSPRRGCGRGVSALHQMPEFLQPDAPFLGRRHVDRRELIAPVPRPTGVDDGAAVGVIAGRLALGLDARIERRRPGVADDVDRGGGIRARDQRPDHLFQVRDVDVFVDHDHIAPAIGADVALRGDVAGLLAVARIALVHRDAEEQPRIADLVRPGRGDAGHAGLLDILAQQRRAHYGAVAADLVRWPLRHAAEQDRLVAMIDRLDVDHRLGPVVAGVIAGPFAEWPFESHIVGLDETFDGDLGIGGDRQAGNRALDHLYGRAAHAADDIELADAGRHFARAHEETHRIPAADNDHRLSLAD